MVGGLWVRLCGQSLVSGRWHARQSAGYVLGGMGSQKRCSRPIYFLLCMAKASMKLLHSSDWHLGIELEGYRRDDEHEHFLDWLWRRLFDEEIDVLLVSGDIFHQSNPSASALAMFYRFVERLEEIPTLRRAVFIAGNHDSPARLEAPVPLFSGRKAHLVGGYQRDAEDALLVPVYDDAGEVSLVVVAVPYIHEVRLGVSPVRFESEGLREATISAFESLYTRLAERAQERWAGADIVGMGHLTCGESSEGDYGTPLHNVGTIDALPPSIFDGSLYRYVALGHIHRGYRVGEGPANYSGSPLSMRFTASELSPRTVVEFDCTRGEYVRVPIPSFRQLKHVRGTLESLEAELRELKRHAVVPTWVSVTVQTKEWMLGAAEHFQAWDDARFRILQVHQERVRDVEDCARRDPLPDVRTMTPTDVFNTLYSLRYPGEAPTDGVRRKFDQAVLSAQGRDE